MNHKNDAGIIDQNKLLGNLGEMLHYAAVVPDVYEMSLFAICFYTGAAGAFIAVDGNTQYFDCVVGSYKMKRHSIKSGTHVWDYEIPGQGEMIQTAGIWLYKTHAAGWLYGIDSRHKPSDQFIESANAVSLSAIGFVRDNEKRIVGKDKLTGLWDRGSFYRDLAHMAEIANKNKSELWLLFVDLNNFKTVNDVLGHSFGDRVLISQASKIQRSITDIGVSYRYGGDEFVCIISGQEKKQILDIVRRIETASEESPGGVKVSASVGASQYIHGEDPEKFIGRADEGMFEAKRLYKERMMREGEKISR